MQTKPLGFMPVNIIVGLSLYRDSKGLSESKSVSFQPRFPVTILVFSEADLNDTIVACVRPTRFPRCLTRQLLCSLSILGVCDNRTVS